MDLRKEKDRLLTDNKNHQKRFDEFQGDLITQFNEMLTQQSENKKEPDSADDWYDRDLLKLQQSREENA